MANTGKAGSFTAAPYAGLTQSDASPMLTNLTPFLLQWIITAVSLWVASLLFDGLKFVSFSTLIVSALMLGFANAIIRPMLFVLTLPLTLLTFGLFVLVINAMLIQLVAWLIKGFSVSSFWTAFFASIFISLFSILIGSLIPGDTPETKIQMPNNGKWL